MIGDGEEGNCAIIRWKRRRGDGRMDVRTNGKSTHSTGLPPVSGPLPKIIKKFHKFIYLLGQPPFQKKIVGEEV